MMKMMTRFELVRFLVYSLLLQAALSSWVGGDGGRVWREWAEDIDVGHSGGA